MLEKALLELHKINAPIDYATNVEFLINICRNGHQSMFELVFSELTKPTFNKYKLSSTLS